MCFDADLLADHESVIGLMLDFMVTCIVIGDFNLDCFINTYYVNKYKNIVQNIEIIDDVITNNTNINCNVNYTAKFNDHVIMGVVVLGSDTLNVDKDINT